ncbi:MAG TPA: arylamine N-acetyltransferase [Blastocatellia bacterium]|nr:arylamine N-acetyltransferase [Blastocatellia bacterium]
MSFNITAYLERINYSGPVEPTAATLREVHKAHLLAAPFENLDIHLGREIVLDEQKNYSKIVERRRGGFCYELNGAFAMLLRALGYDVKMLSAGVADQNGEFGPPFDHMTLVVELEQRWLADVGFGDSFREPLLLDEPGEQAQKWGAYRIARDGEQLTLEQRAGNLWKPQYRFTLQPYGFTDFAEMCRYHQTSPDSHFTQRRTCSLATVDGRITLADMRLITTKGIERQERELTDEQEYTTVLRERFGMEL